MKWFYHAKRLSGLVGVLVGGLFYEVIEKIGTASGISKLDSAVRRAQVMRITPIWGFILILLVSGIIRYLAALMGRNRDVRNTWSIVDRCGPRRRHGLGFPNEHDHFHADSHLKD